MALQNISFKKVVREIREGKQVRMPDIHQTNQGQDNKAEEKTEPFFE